jgi:ABC-2 type transport system ATP-binding protein
MPVVEVNHVSKSFAGRIAVKDISLAVEAGEVFGLIGPNGAGKTTTIRMVLDIIKPDSGSIMVMGQRLGEETKNKLGYLPEERGLYRKLKVMDCLLYLSALKGLDGRLAVTRAEDYLNRVGLLSSKNKKIEELSKGMGQLVQFILTILPDPQLIILDEPFSGLDPVNTEVLKTILLDLRSQGKALILSTHQMNQVEELCDRILMVDHGEAVLYGGLADIKAGYRHNTVLLEMEGEPGAMPGVSVHSSRKGYFELTLDERTSAQQVLAKLIQDGKSIQRFEVAAPSLNEIFIKVAGKKNE